MAALPEPRFVVRSVTGFGPTNGGGRKPTTIWYVYDRPWCYGIVGEFRRGYKHPDPEAEAHAHALLLELESKLG